MDDYPNITHVVYPSATGGKFLINCLGLNDKAIFQHKELAQKQMDGKFTVEDKINYINEQLSISLETGNWYDLNLGDAELYNRYTDRTSYPYPEFLYKKQKTAILKKCIENKLHWFTVEHSLQELESQKKVWTNSNVIIYKNYKNFLKERVGVHSIIKDLWRNLKGESWGSCKAPRDLEEYNELPNFIKKELAEDYEDRIYQYLEDEEELYTLWHVYSKKLEKKFKVFEFDVEYAYKNIENFYNTYDQVCDFIKVPPAKYEIILSYFEKWRDTIVIAKAIRQPDYDWS